MALHIVALIAGICAAWRSLWMPFRRLFCRDGRPDGSGSRDFFYRDLEPWTVFAGRMRDERAREQVYSAYGPLSLLLLLFLWAMLLILGFALFYFALGTPFTDVMGVQTAAGLSRFRTDLYVSGTTLFTLGLGDVVPHSLGARTLIIFESGVGLGFVALVIGYLPVLYQAFSRREVSIALLDARAGSPPTAAELLRRHGFEGGRRGADRAAGGVGALVGRDTGVAYLVPDSLLLPVAARQPELAFGAGGDTGYLRSADLGNGRSGVAAGAVDVCDGASCADRPGAWCFT